MKRSIALLLAMLLLLCAVTAFADGAYTNAFTTGSYTIYVPDGWYGEENGEGWLYLYGKGGVYTGYIAMTVYDISAVYSGDLTEEQTWEIYGPLSSAFVKESGTGTSKAEHFYINGKLAYYVSLEVENIPTYVVILYNDGELLFCSAMVSGEEEAKKIFSGISIAEKAAEPAPTGVDPKYTTIGGIVTFGSYEQDNNTGNGKEPIEWIVVDVQGDSALLVSRYALDAKPFISKRMTATWDSCSLRDWLNDTFFHDAFSTAERAAILTTNVKNDPSQGYAGYRKNGGIDTEDKVFLLSYAEAWKYFTNADRACLATTYALKQGAYGSSTSKTWYWLRSPGEEETGPCMVLWDGTLDYDMYDGCSGGVRPCIRIDLTNPLFAAKAGETASAAPSEKMNIDYENAESFEAALNKGVNVTGKVVRFKVNSVHPDSKLGFNLWAGEHLNFVADAPFEVKDGDVLTVRIRQSKKVLGSWALYFDIVG